MLQNLQKLLIKSLNTNVVWHKLLIFGFDMVMVGLILYLFCVRAFPLTLPVLAQSESLKIYDRKGALLRDVFADPWGRTVVVPLNSISPEYLAVVKSIEDRRFEYHAGVDPLAIGRALVGNFRYAHMQSGASTITQQLVRILWSQGKSRTFVTKMSEGLLALRLDASNPKDSILTQYVNRLSFGNNCRGIESAMLCGLSQNPTANNPYGKGFVRHQRRYLGKCRKLLKSRAIDSLEYGRIARNFPAFSVFSAYNNAPHFVNYVLKRVPQAGLSRVVTTLDMPLQLECERIVDNWVSIGAPYNLTNAAVLVVDNCTGEIVAYVGSRDFTDQEHAGQVDGVQSLRQPGSAIKPFLYTLALAQGFTTASILPDISTRFSTAEGVFQPLNYDKEFHGPVRLRQALACSYNISTVDLCCKITPTVFLDALHKTGFASLTKSAQEYGPGLALGNGEVTLFDLVRAYTVFPRRGSYSSLKSIRGCQIDGVKMPFPTSDSIVSTPYSDVAIRLIENILSDNDARAPAFGISSALNLPFPCAVKTGTSKDFKDNWCVGWTSRFTVGVWAGNFDGSPMHGVSGVSGAAPIFSEIMLALDKKNSPLDLEHHRSNDFVTLRICPLSGMQVGTHCVGSILEHFSAGTEPQRICEFHEVDGLRLPPEYVEWANTRGIKLAGSLPPLLQNTSAQAIQSPRNGDVFALDPDIPLESQKIKISLLPPSPDSVRYLCIDNDTLILESPFVYYWTLRPGLHTISIGASGFFQRSETISFHVVGAHPEIRYPL